MMKKSIIALAVMAAAAGSVAAADVQLYGRVNLGLNYTESDMGMCLTKRWWEVKPRNIRSQ